MKNKLLIYFGIIMFVTISISAVHADTGTYLIEKQIVNLTVHTDRSVDIEYYMKWKVTGGNIPWVTVGMPTSDYQIITFSGDAQDVKHYDSGGFSGVYVTLDKTYYQNEVFEFTVKMKQNNFIKNYNGKASIEFTPTWWDNSGIDQEIVSLTPPNEISSIEAGVNPTRYEGKSAVWEWDNVGRGTRNKMSALMDINAFPGLNETGSSGMGSLFGDSSGTDTNSSWIWWLFGGVALFFIIRTVFSAFSDDYSSPSAHLSSSHSSTRHINMNCPNDNAPLNKRTVKENTVDFCDVCAGIFFDKGEVELLIKANVDEKEFNTNNKKALAEPKKIISKCPRCEGAMNKKERNKNNVSATIFVCEDCEGIWMNTGTYQLIKDKRLEQEKDAKKKKDEDKKDSYFPMAWWLFYPHIGSTGAASLSSAAHFGGGSFGGGGSSGGRSSPAVSSCVSCACVSACACACACAGGGAAGCSPKNKIPQIQLDKLYPKQKEVKK